MKLKGFYLFILGISVGFATIILSSSQIHENEVMESATYRGTVYKTTIYEDYTSILVQNVSKMDGPSIYGGIKLIISEYEDKVELGDCIIFTGEMRCFVGQRNPGGFDEKTYYYGKGVYHKISVDNLMICGPGPYGKSISALFYDCLLTIKVDISETIDLLWSGQTGEMVDAMLLGQDKMIDIETRTLLKETGLSHILALSGLHLSIIVLGVYKTIRTGIRPYGELVAILFMFGYVTLTGAEISTVRAGLMLLIYFMGIMIKRRYDPLSGLIATVVIMTLNNPYQVFQIGFQLSVAAVFGIIFLGPQIQERIGEFTREKDINYKGQAILKILSPLLGIALTTSPLILYNFYGISLISIPANLIILPLVPIFIISSILAVILYQVHIGFSGMLAFFSRFINQIIMTISKIMCHIPFHYISISKPKFEMIVIYYLILILWLFRFQGVKGYMQKRLLKYLVVFGVCLQIIISVVLWNRLNITHFDVGQGDACLIEYKGNNWLVDSGGEILKFDSDNVGLTVVLKALQSKGINYLDGVFITHSDFDHIYGLIEILPYVEIGQIYLPKPYLWYHDPLLDTLYESISNYDTDIVYIDASFEMVSKELIIDCIYPLDDTVYEDNNNHSLVLSIKKGHFDYLLTGDIRSEAETLILDSYNLFHIEGIKVAHHGSASSSLPEFIEPLNPDVAIISVSPYNLYGHPAYVTLSTFKDYDCDVYQTKDLGAVSIYYDGFMVYYMDSMLKNERVGYSCN